MMMMLVVVLVMMLVMLVMMLTVSVTVTTLVIKVRYELGRRWWNREWLAGHQGSRCWQQSCWGIGTSLPLLHG